MFSFRLTTSSSVEGLLILRVQLLEIFDYVSGLYNFLKFSQAVPSCTDDSMLIRKGLDCLNSFNLLFLINLSIKLIE